MGIFAQLTGNAETLYEEGIQAARVKNYDKALRLLEKAARRGHVKAQRRCAWMYGAGRVGEKNPEKAFYWFEQAARQGDAEAQYQCARRCQTGRGTEKDPEAALQWLQKSAAQGYKEAQEALRGPEKEVSLTVNGQETTLAQLEHTAWQGDSDAQFACGVLYLQGEGVEADLPASLTWFDRARRSGHPQAEDAQKAVVEIMSEQLYVQGVTARDPAAALDCFQKAAGFGLARAQFDCGTLYEEGTAGAVDLEKALTFYEKAARQGHVPARMACARMYAHGEGTAAKPEKALYWYEKAAEQGEPRAQFVCAERYKKGEGCPVDRKKALYWMERAAQQGDILSQYLCGLMYKNGEGTAADPEKALSWLQKAAEQGHPEAKKEIGRLRRAQHPAASPMEAALQAFREKDYSEARRLASPLAQAGELEAQMFLGKLCSLGAGKGLEEAFSWFRQAALQGDPEAQYLCAQMCRQGKGTPLDLEAAYSWYEKAALQGHAKAQYQCGLACRKGSGRPKDLEEALSWFQKAAEQGHSEARRSYDVLSQTEKDPEKIFAYYRDTALDGDHDAQLRLGLLYWEHKMPDEAFYWLEKFAAHGESEKETADEESRILRQQGKGKPDPALFQTLSVFARFESGQFYGGDQLFALAKQGIAPAQFFHAKICSGRLFTKLFMGEKPSGSVWEEVFSWYEKAARQGHPKAQLACGLLCRLGLGILEDKERAKSWLERAAAQTERPMTREAANLLLQELF